MQRGIITDNESAPVEVASAKAQGSQKDENTKVKEED